ncbi:hypothetical protein EHW64_06680 [Erwinia psidii]|uniref:hypothetical protein n=1 Tax=Erwinia psidii TaxID=69224 RepID=UPI00226BAE4F|nr:hypothetical protein [Erwinia psidii]MCX8960867.1 hypothetical protein [Erwinia psidii]
MPSVHTKCLPSSFTRTPEVIEKPITKEKNIWQDIIDQGKNDIWKDVISHEEDDIWKDIINWEENDVWKDIIDWQEVNETSFNANDQRTTGESAVSEKADSHVSLTEDSYRALQQLFQLMASNGNSRIISTCLSALLPGISPRIAVAAISLYNAVTRKRNIDYAILNTLELSSWLLPDNLNIISELANFIRKNIVEWIGESFSHPFPEGENTALYEHILIAMAVTAIAVKPWMKNNQAPQRWCLRIPTIMADFLIRANEYWNKLGDIAGTPAPVAAYHEENIPLHRIPAFEVDTCMQTSISRRDDRLGASSSLIGDMTAFSSNSTARYDAAIRATVQNNPKSLALENYSVAEKAHWLATDRLRQESGFSGLSHCATRKTETRHHTDEQIITHSHFNTQCDATAHSTTLAEEKNAVNTIVPQTPVSSVPNQQIVNLPNPGMVATTFAITAYLSSIAGVKGNTISLATVGVFSWGRHLWNRLRTPHQEHIPDGSTDAKNSTINLSPTSLSQPHMRSKRDVVPDESPLYAGDDVFDAEIHHSLIDFLQNEKLLPDTEIDKFKTGDVAAAIAGYIMPADNHRQQTISSVKIQLLAQHILTDSNLYGGKKGEAISNSFAESVVMDMIFRTIMGMSPEWYLADKLAVNKAPLTINALKQTLSLKKILAERQINIPEEKRASIEHIWSLFMKKRFPLFYHPIDNIDNISTDDPEFNWYYSGSLYLADKGKLSDFTSQEILYLGKAIWETAFAEDMSIHSFILLPALLLMAKVRPEEIHAQEDMFYHHVIAINQYFQYQDISLKFEAYRSAVKEWMSRGKLAEKIVNDCGEAIPPTMDVVIEQSPLYFNTEMDLLLRREEAKQDYMDGISKPCAQAPEDLDTAWKKLTEKVADSFADINFYILWSTFSSIEKKDANFIFSPDAIIYPTSFTMEPSYSVEKDLLFSEKLGEQDLYNPGTKHFFEKISAPAVKNINLDKAELITVQVGDEKRIYALKSTGNGDESKYRLIRVDNDISNFIHADILDYRPVNGFTKFSDNGVKDGTGQLFYFSTTENKNENINRQKNELGLINHFNQIYREKLYKSVYDAGNDKSTRQKTWDFFKHLIPFYDCVEGIQNNDPSQAVPACLLDALAFFDTFIKIGSMSGKFGQGLARGMLKGTQGVPQSAVKGLVKNLYQEASFPTIKELAKLGKNVLRSADPGFELLTDTYRILPVYVLDVLKENHASLGKRIESINTAAKKGLHSENYATAKLPHTDFRVPVKGIKDDNGKYFYVQMDPNTGNVFGRRYQLDTDILKPLGQLGHPGQDYADGLLDKLPLCSSRVRRGIDGVKDTLFCIDKKWKVNDEKLLEDINKLPEGMLGRYKNIYINEKSSLPDYYIKQDGDVYKVKWHERKHQWQVVNVANPETHTIPVTLNEIGRWVAKNEASWPKGLPWETSAGTAKIVKEEFILDKHMGMMEVATEKGNFAVSFRKAGKATLNALKNGAAAKPHSILEKTIKESSLSKYYPQNKDEMMAKVHNAGIEGLVGHWDEKKGLVGIYLTNNMQLENVMTTSEGIFIYPVDINQLDTSLHALKQHKNWIKNCYTGDYDMHDLIVFNHAGRPRTPLIGKEEEDLIKKLNQEIKRTDALRSHDSATHRAVQHGAQINYATYMIKNNFEGGDGMVLDVANPGEYPIAMLDRGVWSVIHNLAEHEKYYQQIGAKLKETWSADGSVVLTKGGIKPRSHQE